MPAKEKHTRSKSSSFMGHFHVQSSHGLSMAASCLPPGSASWSALLPRSSSSRSCSLSSVSWPHRGPAMAQHCGSLVPALPSLRHSAVGCQTVSQARPGRFCETWSPRKIMYQMCCFGEFPNLEVCCLLLSPLFLHVWVVMRLDVRRKMRRLFVKSSIKHVAVHSAYCWQRVILLTHRAGVSVTFCIY